MVWVSQPASRSGVIGVCRGRNIVTINTGGYPYSAFGPILKHRAGLTDGWGLRV